VKRLAELVTRKEQISLCDKLVEYYKKIYEGTEFAKEEKILSHAEVGEVEYTYPGPQNEVDAAVKMNAIAKALRLGYDAPAIVLKKNGRLILVDGHRRLRVAWEQGIGWPALLIVPSKPVSFGVEKTVMGKIKDLFKT